MIFHCQVYLPVSISITCVYHVCCCRRLGHYQHGCFIFTNKPTIWGPSTKAFYYFEKPPHETTKSQTSVELWKEGLAPKHDLVHNRIWPRSVTTEPSRVNGCSWRHRDDSTQRGQRKVTRNPVLLVNNTN